MIFKIVALSAALKKNGSREKQFLIKFYPGNRVITVKYVKNKQSIM